VVKGRAPTCDVDGTLGCALEVAKPYIVLSAALLPAMGAATAGVRFTGDFDECATRSKEMANSLERSRADYERTKDRIDFDLAAETPCRHRPHNDRGFERLALQNGDRGAGRGDGSMPGYTGTNSKNPNPLRVGASVRRQSASPLIIVSVSRLSFKSYLLPSEA
jgi:hypothetical protein